MYGCVASPRLLKCRQVRAVCMTFACTCVLVALGVVAHLHGQTALGVVAHLHGQTAYDAMQGHRSSHANQHGRPGEHCWQAQKQ